MQISAEDWRKYALRQDQINSAATRLMERWMANHPGSGIGDMVTAAQALAERYGEAAASLACEMYDAIAAAQKAAVKAAEMAKVATRSETEAAIRGVLETKNSTVPATVGKLVKQAAADTMLENAARDGAEYAWIPQGDSCAFCLMLSSRGWQKQRWRRGGHASHIHPNCNCEYAVRFDGRSTVEGYAPGEYRQMYDSAEGDTWQDKLNTMRRAQYAEDKDRINAQKREAYAERKERGGTT